MKYFELINLYHVHSDAASFLNSRILFQDPATPIMEGIIDLHHYICFFLIVVLLFVSWVLVAIICRFGFFPKIHFYTTWLVAEGKVPLWMHEFISITPDNLLRFRFLDDKFTRLYCIFNDIKLKKDYLYFKNLSYSRTFYHIYKLVKFQVYKKNYAKAFALINKGYGITHGTTIEIIWTIIPSIILIIIAIPSFVLLYSMDEVVTDNLSLTIKVVGHQWYWNYQISDLREDCYLKKVPNYSLSFDSYMIPDEDLKDGELRLLEVDNALKVPVKTHIRILVSSRDVLHSWAIPSLGVKIDAVPGRLNQTSMFIKREGIYYGQCSEICGVNHAFMPIKIQTIPKWWVDILRSI